MERLRNKFLNVPIDAVLHPASDSAQQVAKEQKDKATMAAEAQHRAEEERRKRRKEAAARHRAEEERRRDEKRRRPEEEHVRAAKLEEERVRRGPEEQHQQRLTWLLPLIGAGIAASFSLFLAALAIAQGMPLKGSSHYDVLFALSIINALAGGVAGKLVQRFGTRIALGITGIPLILVWFAVLSFIGMPLRLNLNLTFAVVFLYIFPSGMAFNMIANTPLKHDSSMAGGHEALLPDHHHAMRR
jgi:phage-related holin